MDAGGHAYHARHYCGQDALIIAGNSLHGTENCGYTSFDQCWATIGAEGGFCRPNPFPGSAYGTGYTWGQSR
jgi:hypothetical protein